jgi:hypothetical protein
MFLPECTRLREVSENPADGRQGRSERYDRAKRSTLSNS